MSHRCRRNWHHCRKKHKVTRCDMGTGSKVTARSVQTVDREGWSLARMWPSIRSSCAALAAMTVDWPTHFSHKLNVEVHLSPTTHKTVSNWWIESLLCTILLWLALVAGAGARHCSCQLFSNKRLLGPLLKHRKMQNSVCDSFFWHSLWSKLVCHNAPMSKMLLPWWWFNNGTSSPRTSRSHILWTFALSKRSHVSNDCSGAADSSKHENQIAAIEDSCL